MLQAGVLPLPLTSSALLQHPAVASQTASTSRPWAASAIQQHKWAPCSGWQLSVDPTLYQANRSYPVNPMFWTLPSSTVGHQKAHLVGPCLWSTDPCGSTRPDHQPASV